MDNANEQINPIVVRYLPHLVGAPAILAHGWLVARALAAIVRGALRHTNIDNRGGALAHGRNRGG